MDGPNPEFLPPAHSERERRERVLLNLLSFHTPREFWIAVRSGITSTYRETFDANQNNSRVLQQSHGFKTTHDRHYYCDKVLHDAALEFGFTCIPELIQINSWRYAQATFGCFTSIQKYTWSPGELPKAAKFRKQLARSGGIGIQSDLLRPRLVRVDESQVYNGMLIHGPTSRVHRSPDFRDVGFICFAIPLEDYSGWGAVFPVDRLISECQIQGKGTGEGEASRDSGPGPTWRKRPDQED